MSSGQLGTVLHYLRRLAVPRRVGDLADSQLLERFLREKDPAAFTALVQRHGPLVLGVCRRVLHDDHAADDAFQATFLVFVRRACALHKRESLGSWLHGVAYRIALKARAAATRQRTRERQVSSMVSVDADRDLHQRELRTMLDDEVSRLPNHYRQPVILCYLQGKTLDAAAGEFGCPRGTIATRLNRARDLLRTRLTRRGVGLSTGGLAVTLLQEASATVPPALLETTVQAALQYVAGGALSGPAVALAEGVLRTMGTTKLQIAGVMVLALGLAVTGVALRAHSSPAAEPKPAATAVPPAPDAAEDKVQEQVRAAVEKGVRYLKASQRGNNWEAVGLGLGRYDGGVSSLALLALLEASVKVDDAAVQPGLDYLRLIDPKDTYVVGLQTAVFARANLKKDEALLRRNVEWLVASMRKDANGQFIGWGYQKEAGLPGSDNSNTQFAVLGLHAAAQAGITIEDKVWREIRDYYVRTQLPGGGWPYRSEGARGDTLTMTCGGVSGLAIAAGQLKEKPGKELDRALERLGRSYTIDVGQWQYYSLHGLARAARLSGTRVFSDNHDWYREGAKYLLSKQNAVGAWRSDSPLDGNPIIATSFALLFLAKGK